MDNSFTFSYTGFNNTTPTVRATVVQPALTIAKTRTTTPVDAGDTVVYNIVVTNPSGGNNQTAFDSVISDTINSNLTLQSIVITTNPIGLANTDNSVIGSNLLNVAVPRLDPGQSLTFVVTAKVLDNAATSTLIPNLARVTWTSLPGDNGTTPNPTGSTTPGTPGSSTGERTGSGTSPNTYVANSNVNTTLSGAPLVDKKAPAKSNYTIGEEIVYDILVTLPEGVTKSLRVIDTLPTGLAYVTSQVITTTAGSPLLTSNFAGTLATPSFSQAGSVNTWTFGDTTVPGTPAPGSSSFVIRMTAVVQNILSNQRTINRDNVASLKYFNPSISGDSTITDPYVRITIVEPVLQVAKTVVTAPNADAGDVVTYTIVLKHDAANSVGMAYEVILTDTLPANLTNYAISSVTGANVTAPSAAITAGVLRMPATGSFDLPNNGTVTVVMTARILDSVQPGTVINNSTNATWSTLPGTPPEERKSGNGLLDGGGLNDYEVKSTVPFTVANQATVTKAFLASSAAHTSGQNVTIGEIVTYRVAVTLGEGTLPSLVLTDTVPTGMAYVGGTAVIDSTGFGGSLPAPSITPAGNGTSGQKVVVTFGQVVVTGDNNLSNNSFTVDLQLRVLDVPANVGVTPQTVLPNSVTWRAGADTPKTTNIVNVTVVEPKMSIRKALAPKLAAANDTVTVTLVISNIGTSIAFSATLTDAVPTGLIFDGGLVSKSGPAPVTLSESGGVINAVWDQFSVGPIATIVFRTKLAPNVTLNQVIVNTASVDKASTLPGIDPGERTEPKVQSSDSVTVIAPDLRITKDDGLTQVVGGQLLVYTLAIDNIGARAADGVVISDTVPANTTFNAASSSAGWKRADNSACATGDPAGTVCHLDLGTLAAGASTSKTFAVRVDSNIPYSVQTIDNIVSVRDDGSHGPDPTPSNNRSTDTDTHVSAGLGDYVWQDVNGNGTQDAGEPAVAGVTVRLLQSNGTLITSTTTSATGYYSFTNLVPAGYIVEFVPPSNMRITLPDVGDDTTDSDANRVTGRSPVVTLPAAHLQPDHRRRPVHPGGTGRLRLA